MSIHRNCRVFVGFRLLAWMLVFVATASAQAAATDEPPLKSGVDKANFDTTIKPGDNFFEYVNGKWIKENPIPAEYSRWGAFPKLHDDNLAALRQIVEGLEKSTKPLDDNAQAARLL